MDTIVLLCAFCFLLTDPILEVNTFEISTCHGKKAIARLSCNLSAARNSPLQLAINLSQISRMCARHNQSPPSLHAYFYHRISYITIWIWIDVQASLMEIRASQSATTNPVCRRCSLLTVPRNTIAIIALSSNISTCLWWDLRVILLAIIVAISTVDLFVRESKYNSKFRRQKKDSKSPKEFLHL